MNLTDLPNIGPVLAENLRAVGVETPEQLRELGAREAFFRIRVQRDSAACFHQLTALAGTEKGVRKTELTSEEKRDLRTFFDSL